MAAVIVIVAGVFIAGAVFGVIAVVSFGIRREERDFSLTRRAPDRTSSAARFLTGLWVRHRSDLNAEFASWQNSLV